MATRREAVGLMLGLPALGALGWPDSGEGASAQMQAKPKPGNLLIEAHAKLLMIGDSITDVERARPVGEGRDPALGRGYVQTVDALLGAVYPDQWIRVVNMGISGNTTRDLKARWQTD